MSCLLLPLPTRTADENSFTAHESPAPTSNPAAAIRRRASTPASYQEPPVLVTQPSQAPTFTSASAWKLPPRARSGPATPLRIWVLSAASDGTDTKYCAHGDGSAASACASDSEPVAA